MLKVETPLCFKLLNLMTTYIFRVRTPDNIVHQVQCNELPDLDAAMAQAQRYARTLVRNPVRRGARTIGGALDVEVADRAIARLLLSEVAIQIS
ncbi:DUF6894 family protein [Sphingomonas mucosissima]|uniref:DUF6894 domain-containing protein n=1 Tax=Sphingomonas mucosissima TaxID=370959 RepID=A0A245ZIL0_9SPHN|nr:hypothetical protein [Sphingomonas mucosissima]OWK29564.1 hypothetical protein SPMU_19840 [Sphingomonas mucosissima]